MNTESRYMCPDCGGLELKGVEKDTYRCRHCGALSKVGLVKVPICMEIKGMVDSVGADFCNEGGFDMNIIGTIDGVAHDVVKVHTNVLGDKVLHDSRALCGKRVKIIIMEDV